ncbi:RF-1 domain-containing protein [Halteromyces radiatus]|uniref:RF-1 domain-containing protein n=1 Tax=Halteromyces radiatus TaxID=101107 RepID=UPI00221FBE90|nr:RF-1 domain-containing protein [Halteromyces radiatus]KAI8093039.1 RF-1 domain-containing protein [Halteromyces radiatus]
MLCILSRLYSPLKTTIPSIYPKPFNRFMSTISSTTPTTTTNLTSTTSSLRKPERKKIILRDEDLVEKFVKGSGPGGQCINKRSSCVDLKHIPTGIRVQCQQTRSLQENRGIARKLLKEKLDDLWNGSLSKNAKKSNKIAKQKARSARRARQKYGTCNNNNNNSSNNDSI